jgi:hypothetical protein
MTKKDLSFKSWIVAFTVVAVIGGSVLYFGLFHLALRIPLSRVTFPYALHAALTILIAPVFYMARKKQVATSGADVRVYFWGVGAYCLCVLFCWTFFGVRAGVIPRHYETKFYMVSGIASIGGTVAGYFANKIAFPKRGHTKMAD